MTTSLKLFLNFKFVLLFIAGTTQQSCSEQSPDSKSGVRGTLPEAANTKPDSGGDTAIYQNIRLISVKQSDLNGQYINKVWSEGRYQLALFDGKQEYTHFCDAQEYVEVSQNQNYFTLYRVKAGISDSPPYYEVELRNSSNRIIGKEQISVLGSDEREDEIYPLGDGSGFIQKAMLLSGGLYFSIYRKLQSDRRYSEVLHVDKRQYINGQLSVDLEQNLIIASFMGPPVENDEPNCYIHCYNFDGSLIWETAIPNHFIKSDLYISPFDGTLVFVTKKLNDDDNKHLFIYKKDGALSKKFPVYKGGLYKCRFQLVNGIQYLLAPSDGEYYYVIDVERNTIINKQTKAKQNSFVTGLVISNNYILSSYFCGEYITGNDNRQVFQISERGIMLEDQNGKIVYDKIQSAGIPFILFKEKEIFLVEKPQRKPSKNNMYFKLEITDRRSKPHSGGGM